jgi:hypothetical protein
MNPAEPDAVVSTPARCQRQVFPKETPNTTFEL